MAEDSGTLLYGHLRIENEMNSNEGSRTLG